MKTKNRRSIEVSSPGPQDRPASEKMTVLSFVSKRRTIRQQSAQLVEIIQHRIPTARQACLQRAQLPARAAKAIRDIAGAAARFAHEHRWGWLARAYLANRVKWGLIECGYATPFAESVTTSVVLAMADGGPR